MKGMLKGIHNLIHAPNKKWHYTTLPSIEVHLDNLK